MRRNLSSAFLGDANNPTAWAMSGRRQRVGTTKRRDMNFYIWIR